MVRRDDDGDTMIDFGFRAMDLTRIQATCKAEHAASARVMEKAGMTFEGTLRAYVVNKGTPHDLKMYANLRPEWQTSARLVSR